MNCEADFRGECSLTTAMWWWNIRFLSSPSKLNWTGEGHPVNLNGFSLRAAGAILGNVVGLKAIFQNLKIGAKKCSKQGRQVVAKINSSVWKNGNSCHVLTEASAAPRVLVSVVKLSRVDHVGWSSTTHKTVWRSIFTQRKDAIEFEEKRGTKTYFGSLST